MRKELCIKNHLSELEKVAQFIEEIGEELGLDMELQMNLNLVMEEMVSNVIFYAYPEGTQGDINIEAKANDLRLKFIITDSGTPFDPTAQKEMDTTLSAEERPIGGSWHSSGTSNHGLHQLRKSE